MLWCWAYKPIERPNFSECLLVIKDLISSEGQFDSLLSIKGIPNLNTTVNSQDSLKNSLTNENSTLPLRIQAQRNLPTNTNSDSGLVSPNYLQLLMQEQMRLSSLSNSQANSAQSRLSSLSGQAYDVPKGRLASISRRHDNRNREEYEMPPTLSDQINCQCKEKTGVPYQNMKIPHICST